MILATTKKNEMQSDSLFWLTCVAQYKWWLSSVITHPPDVAQNSNYLSIRYHIFTRNHNVLSTDKGCFFVTVASSDTLTFPYTQIFLWGHQFRYLDFSPYFQGGNRYSCSQFAKVFKEHMILNVSGKKLQIIPEIE